MRVVLEKLGNPAMYRVPALARLLKAFPSVDPDDVYAARRLLQAGKVRRAASKLGMDVEDLASGDWGNPGTVSLGRYMNAGDTYATTLGKFAGSNTWYLTTMGDMVESLERRGKLVF